MKIHVYVLYHFRSYKKLLKSQISHVSDPTITVIDYRANWNLSLIWTQQSAIISVVVTKSYIQYLPSQKNIVGFE